MAKTWHRFHIFFLTILCTQESYEVDLHCIDYTYVIKSGPQKSNTYIGFSEQNIWNSDNIFNP